MESKLLCLCRMLVECITRPNIFDNMLINKMNQFATNQYNYWLPPKKKKKKKSIIVILGFPKREQNK